MSDPLFPSTLMSPTAPNTERDINRGGRRPRHGVRQLARQLAVVKPTGTSTPPPPVPRRMVRALNRLQRDLDARPMETIRDGLVDAIAADTIIEQRANRELLASPDLRNELGLSKFKFWIAGRLDRARDQLIQLERLRADRAGTPCRDCGARLADLHAYLTHHDECPKRAAEPASDDDAADEPDIQPEAAEAASEPGCSEEVQP
jgi:hypothetical protein